MGRALIGLRFGLDLLDRWTTAAEANVGGFGLGFDPAWKNAQAFIGYRTSLFGAPTIVNNYAFTAFMTGGFVAGIVYWLVAGRSAADRRRAAEAEAAAQSAAAKSAAASRRAPGPVT